MKITSSDIQIGDCVVYRSMWDDSVFFVGQITDKGDTSMHVKQYNPESGSIESYTLISRIVINIRIMEELIDELTFV